MTKNIKSPDNTVRASHIYLILSVEEII